MKGMNMIDQETSVTRRAVLSAAGAAAVVASGTLAAGRAAAPRKQSSDRKIRLGVVGGGFGASWAWHKHPNCKVVAVSDLQKP